MSTSHSFRPAPPPLVLGLVEGARVVSEVGWFLSVRHWLAKGRDGAGRPVLVIPGLRASDWSTRSLRSLLRSVNYDAHGWGLGINIGPTQAIVSGLDELLLSIRDRHDAPVSVVGQSLGGFMGAELARRNPGAVDRLITLGGPMAIVDLRQSRAGAEYNKHRHKHLSEFEFETWRQAPHPKIPSTSIYSRSDGIVHWRACHYPESELTENIEVYGSHVGMAFSPPAVYAVLDRLAVPVGEWRKFQAPRLLRGYFPTPRQAA
jgi:pimeloyl-ACP methyl ester carboxylesterase